MPAENRLAVLLSAPLALQRRGGSGHEGGGRFVPVPSLDFERERRLLVASLREGCRETGRNIEARAGSPSPPPPRARFDPINRRGYRLRLRHARARGAAAPPPSLPSPGRHPFLTVLTFPPPLFSLVHSRRPADARAFGLGVRSIYPSTAPRGAQLRVEPATSDSLRTMVTLGCAALHFAGHGHPDFLCFEVSNDVAHKDLISKH